MPKKYIEKNVYDALQERFKFIFEEFDNIYVSFSGGKDSGLLLNLILKYVRENNIKNKIGVFHQDFEAQYEKTTEYVTKTFEDNLNNIEPYWICLPMATRTAMSSSEMFWYPWDDEKQDIWVREMPNLPYVINLKNNIFDLYKYKMHQEDLAHQFGRWYRKTHNNGKTISLLGVRADESLHRYSGIVNKIYDYKGKKWITKNFKEVWSASPIYDWTTEDVWIANAKFNFDYNKLYDLYYKAGLTINQMRVASPFNDYAKGSLNLYRVLEPKTWTKIVGRVQGANFASIYGNTKAMGYREVSLPKGHTWKSFTEFLLNTLNDDIRKNYLDKFETSDIFWANIGGGLSEESIKEIESLGYNIKKNGISNYTKNKQNKIIFIGDIPDHMDDVKTTINVPSWKRKAYTILKNDHMCKFMGFGLTKQQQMKVDKIKAKYRLIQKGR